MAAKRSLSLLVPLIGLAIYSQASYLWKLIGRVDIDQPRLVRWENSTALNNHDCEVIRAANACEDVKIHFPSQTAFLACGDPLERTHWYPCAGVRTVKLRAESSFREQLFKYDAKTGQTTALELHGLQGDFVTHGLDILPLPEDPSKIHIFAVNHARDGDSIAIFVHELGSSAAQLVKNVKHPAIKTANGVAATGPLSFFVTNDHYAASGPLRVLEEQYGPFTWSSDVQHCDAHSEDVSCKQVGGGTFPNANGINLWQDRLFVGDARNGTVTVFEIHPDKTLTKLRVVDVGAGADNINILPTTGDPIIAVFPTLEDLPTYLDNVKSLGKEFLVPAAALRLDHTNDYAPELIYFDDGSVVSFMTAVAVDPVDGFLIVSGILQYGGFAVCKVPPDAFARISPQP
ncbi:hypothetical protein A1O3_06496 [Capronia epimyces CBS 606.96]|uniref:Uncharacterized protein n=1 Tax=Capronia epimyces CBS 606.96 TaxID=1182542 RepID=W9XQ51_9EURO|nr:uncharacterized protein A1O3_06496 [Capronia epimyces CBS 606.96]EXJ82682.1 hypothetical protein A1O3_06496 [Capronia epimyces CBS 606.96]